MYTDTSSTENPEHDKNKKSYPGISHSKLKTKDKEKNL